MAEHLVAGMRCSEVRDLAPSFVLGALEPAEADTVRRHLADCPDAHAEVLEFGAVVPALLEIVEVVAPPEGLRGRILAAAAETPQVPDTAADTQVRVADTQVADRERTPLRLPPVVDERERTWGAGLLRRPIWAAVAIAAALAVVALGAWNLQLRNELAGLAAYRDGVVAVLDQARQPGAQLAVLTSPEGTGGPSGLAAVAADGDVALVMGDLAPTTGTQVYEAWLIGANGTPVPIGDFTVGASGAGSFTTSTASLEPGVTVALTLEPGPGATVPTEPIIAVGAARSQPS